MTLTQSSNRLLASLRDVDYERIYPHLRTVRLPFRTVVLKDGHPVSDVLFPTSATCSMIKTMRNGETTEIATIGNEGAVGVRPCVGPIESTVDCVVRVPGEASALSADVFQSEMERRSTFFDLILGCDQGFTNQIMQAAACHALHSAEQRCCRWLLTAHDRTRADGFPLTHDFVAAMLGVRRPTVSIIFASLQNAGMIRYSRGRISIHDRLALERASCECYRAINTALSRPERGETPEVAADRRITFRVFAPQAQAIRLAAGDIPGVGQITQLSKSPNGSGR